MKTINIFVFLLILHQAVFSQQTVEDLMSDSAKLYFEYIGYNGFVNDSIYGKSAKISVFIGQKAAVYIYQYQTPEQFLQWRVENSDPRFVTPEEEISFTKKRYDVEKMVTTVRIRYYGAPDYLTIRKYDEGDVWLSDTTDYKWTLYDEFKNILGYKCQKAIAKIKSGEDIVVWFTEEIPISSGVGFLAGLPGLILESYNSSKKRLLRTTTVSSTNIPNEFFRKWLKGPIVTKDEDREIYQGESEKAKQLLKMLNTNKESY